MKVSGFSSRYLYIDYHVVYKNLCISNLKTNQKKSFLLIYFYFSSTGLQNLQLSSLKIHTTHYYVYYLIIFLVLVRVFHKDATFIKYICDLDALLMSAVEILIFVMKGLA